jgi:Synergist-CTERM protein sorting domain-containing protein
MTAHHQGSRGFTRLTKLTRLVATSHVHSWGVSVGVGASLCAMALLSGCASDEPTLSSTDQASTVASYGSTGCSTAVVIGLSKQIADEAGCENPASFVSFEGAPGITLTSSAVLPYAVKGASDDLKKVAASNSLQLNSALRSIAQQWLLVQWHNQGRCGITAAAAVGHSNHEGGRAVDLSNYSSRISAMAAHGWAHDVAGDPVHFDHTASPDDRGQDTKAFQVLWNKNHPTDQIATDGAYGPQTEARLKQAPATGFAIGPSCTTHQFSADIVSVNGPDQAPPQTVVHYTVMIKNSGAATWPATTQLQITGGDTSPLHDASWASATVVTALGNDIAMGDTATLDFDVLTPAVTEETPVSQAFQLVDGASMFGTINLSLTVAVGADPGQSSDGNDSGDSGDTGSDGGKADGTGPDASSAGCNAGGGVGWLSLVLPALVLRRRRR